MTTHLKAPAARIALLVSGSLLMLVGATNFPTSRAFAEVPPNAEEKISVTPPEDVQGRVAFTAEIDETKAIFVSDIATGRVQRLVYDKGNNYSARIAPDGSQIAFISDRSGTPQVYTIAWNGKDIKQITNSKGEKAYPSWSSDMKSIYYATIMGKGDQKQSNLYFVSLDTSKEMQVTTFKGRNTTPHISPDSTMLAFTTERFWPGWDLCIFDTGSKKENCVLSGDTSFTRPRYSQSGEKLAFVNKKGTESNVGFMDLASPKKITKVPETATQDTEVTWAGESHLLFASSRVKKRPYALSLRSVNSNGARVLITSDYSLREPSWSDVTTEQLEEKELLKEFKVLTFVDEARLSKTEDYKAPYLNPRASKNKEG